MTATLFLRLIFQRRFVFSKGEVERFVRDKAPEEAFVVIIKPIVHL